METIKQVIFSLLTAFIAALLTHWFKDRAYNKDFILGKTYDIHKKLLDKLVNFYYEPEINYDFEGYQKSKTLKNDLRKALKMNFKEYCEEAPKTLFQDIHKVRNIKDHIKQFESWVGDIKEISYLSNKKTRKIAKEIVNKYFEYKSEEKLFQDSIYDEIGYEENAMGKTYAEYRNNIYWENFWIGTVNELKKLKNNLEKFVALK